MLGRAFNLLSGRAKNPTTQTVSSPTPGTQPPVAGTTTAATATVNPPVAPTASQAKKPLTIKEKIFGWIGATLTGLGISTSVGLGTFTLLSAGHGVGMTLGVLGTVIGTSVAGAVSLLIGIPLAYWAYKDYTQKAKALQDEINLETTKKEEKQKEWENALIMIALQVIRAYLIDELAKRLSDSNQKKEDLTEDELKNRIEGILALVGKVQGSNIVIPTGFPDSVKDAMNVIVPSIVAKLQSDPKAYDDLRSELSKDKLDKNKLAPHVQKFQENVDLKAQMVALRDKLKPAPVKPNMREAIKAGVIGFLEVFGLSLGVSGAVAIAAVGATSVITLLSIPVVGWAILGGSLALGLLGGAAFMYFTHKNSKRVAEKESLKTENQKMDTVVSELNTAQKSIKVELKQTVAAQQANLATNRLQQQKSEVDTLTQTVKQKETQVDTLTKTNAELEKKAQASEEATKRAEAKLAEKKAKLKQLKAGYEALNRDLNNLMKNTHPQNSAPTKEEKVEPKDPSASQDGPSTHK